MQGDRAEQTGIKRAVFQRGNGEIRAYRRRIAKIVRARVPENDVPARRRWRRKASCGTGGADRAATYIKTLRIGSHQESRQSEGRHVLHARVYLRNGGKTHRPIAAGTNDVEENGFVARLREAAIDGVVAWVDRINNSARAQCPGEQYAGDQIATPHNATPPAIFLLF